MKKILVVMISLLLILTGCQNVSETADNGVVGIIALSVNPKLEIGYDDNNLVKEIQGKNDNGKAILNNYNDYVGKDVKIVINELVKEINKQGYFIDDIDGYSKDIIIQIKAGSKVKDPNYLYELEEEVKDTISELQLASDLINIEEDDYDPNYTNQYITLTKAQEIALKKVGFMECDVQFIDKDYDLENGKHLYEIEFVKDDIEYEVDVDASNGSVIKVDQNMLDYDDRMKNQIEYKDVKVTFDNAKEIALKKASVTNVELNDIKCELDDDRLVYEIEFIKDNVKYDIDVDANSGQVLDYDSESIIEDENGD